jgi:predicted DNA-binding transcriptional regulator YafY
MAWLVSSRLEMFHKFMQRQKMSKYERLARLLRIVTLVNAQRNLNRKDLARKCEVSVRTIQRDIDTLSYAGVPIFWAEDGYRIMPDFFLPPVNLSLEEAFHLVIATRAFSEDKEDVLQSTIESAVSKIVARLPDETRYRLEAILERPNPEGEELQLLRNSPL